ncbi:hypothetical protein RI367_008508 [Sorochytrium milnesiophthora]
MPSHSVILLAVTCTLLAAAHSAHAQQCTSANVRIRKEVRDMTAAEWSNYASAVQRLHQQQSTGLPQYAGISAFEVYAATHTDNWFTPHSDPRFLPWHRLFLFAYENALRQFSPTLTLPYWGWDEDANGPERSPVTTARYYGSSSGGGGTCIPDGPFRFTTHVVSPTPGSSVNARSPPRCVTRGFNPQGPLSRFTSTAVLSQLIQQASSHSAFSLQLENGPHGQVHTWVGGDMGQRFSPNDPIFFAHHAFIDKLFGDFQTARQLPYDGQAYSWVGRVASWNDPLTPYVKQDGTAFTVADVWNPNSFCVWYAPPQQSQPPSSFFESARAPAAYNGTLPPLPGTENAKPRQLVQLTREWAAMMGIPFDVVAEQHAHILAVERQIVDKVKKGDIASLKYPHAPLPPFAKSQ